MSLDKVAIWNRALAHISGGTIVTETEQSMAAKYCRLFWPTIVRNLLEGPGDFSFGRQRVVLSSVTNDRPQEWLYAYALPSNMASPLRVLPDLTSVGLELPVPLPGNPYAEMWATFLDEIAVPYVIDGSTLYCNANDAILEYEIDDLTGVKVPGKVEIALEYDLASQLAGSPVKKDGALAEKLAQVADLKLQMAIADDRNRQPEAWGNYTSESILARHDYNWGY